MKPLRDKGTVLVLQQALCAPRSAQRVSGEREKDRPTREREIERESARACTALLRADVRKDRERERQRERC